MQKRIHNIESIRGVDITSSPINVAKNRASYMVNMINEGGVNVKRHGWETVAILESGGARLPINGIFEYGDGYIVHAGTHLFKCDANFNIDSELTTSLGVSDTKSKGYVRDGKLWLVGAGDFLVYDGTTLEGVMDSKHTFVPTTSILIKNAIETQCWDYQGARHQGVNLFNKRRINKLLGTTYPSGEYVLDGTVDLTKEIKVEIATSGIMEGKEGALDPGDFKYDYDADGLTDLLGHILKNNPEYHSGMSFTNLYLELIHPVVVSSYDGLIMGRTLGDTEKNVYVTLHTKEGNKTIWVDKDVENYSMEVFGKTVVGITISDTACLNTMAIKGRRIFEGNLTVSTIINGETTSTTIKKDGVDVSDGDYSELLNEFDISVSNGENGLGLVSLNFACPPLIEGVSNISVEYTAVVDREIDISASAVVSLNPGADILCLVNNNNVVYFSDSLYGYGYFPDNDYVGIGKETDKVTAIVQLENHIGIFKANELYRVRLDIASNENEMVEVLSPSIEGFYQGVGCENEFLGLNVNGDTLIYNGTGVNGIISSSSKPTNMRSTNVNRELCAYTREQRQGACAVSHQGRYYLFIEGKVYIGDTRFKYYESNHLDSGFEYEWWIWDNCKCRCAYSTGDKLYMGTDEGEIRVFGEGYKDKTLTVITAQSQQLGYNGEVFSFDSSLCVDDGDLITIANAYEKRLTQDALSVTYHYGYRQYVCTFSQRDFESYYPGALELGKDIVLYDPVYGELKCTVSRVEEDKYLVGLTINEGKYNSLASYALVRDTGTYTAKATENGEFVLVDALGNVVTFLGYEEIGATLIKDTNVCCEMRTGAIDLGKLHAKSLYKLSFTPTRETSGRVVLGYTTNLSDVDKSRVAVGKGYDLWDFDFNEFAFDGGLFKTYIKRVFERNFNYIMLRFASQTDSPFGIENAQAVYSINNELRSDR